MHMGLSLHKFTGFLINVALDSGVMRFGIEVIFILTKGSHCEFFELADNPFHHFRTHLVLFERQGNVQVFIPFPTH